MIKLHHHQSSSKASQSFLGLKLFLILVSMFCLCIPKPGVSQQEISLWEKGAPGFESRKDEPSQAKDWWVKNIHNPSITVFKPAKEKDKGIGVLVVPGGGHRALVYNSEGKGPAEFLTDLGYTAFVLKYRLAREENSPYSLDIHPQ